MADQSYRSTPQTTNRAKVSRVLVDPVTDLFRDLLRHFVAETNFKSELANNKKILLRILYHDQKELLYPQNATFSGGYDQFDLSLLYILLRNICGIDTFGRKWGIPPKPGDNTLAANIDRIRKIRNDCHGHMPKMFLSDYDFAQTWSEIRRIVSELEKELGNSTKYVTAVDFVKKDTLEPEKQQYYIDKLNRQQKIIDDITDKQNQLSLEIQEQKNDLTRKGEDIQSQDKRIWTLEKKVNFEGQSILLCTQKLLEEHHSLETYVKTSSVQATINKLKTYHIAILTGKSGVGKTTTAYQVLLELSKNRPTCPVEGLMANADEVKPCRSPGDVASKQLNSAGAVLYERYDEQELHEEAVDVVSEELGKSGRSEIQQYVPVILTCPDEWSKVIHPDGHFVVLLDEIFGCSNFDSSEFEKWKKMLNIMLSSSKRGNVYLVFGIRSHILKQVRKKMQSLGHYKLEEKYDIDFSTEVFMKFEEKLELVEAFEMHHKYYARDLIGKEFEIFVKKFGENYVWQLSEEEKSDIAKTEPYYGFPQTCSMFFKEKKFYQRGIDFFEKANELLLDEIEEMRQGDLKKKIEYCILSYVFIHGSIHTINFDMKAMQDICQKMGLENVGKLHIKDAVERLKKSQEFLKMAPENENKYTFTHQTLLEAVMVSFGQLAPEIVIRICSKNHLYELIRTQNCKPEKNEVILRIPSELNLNLAERLLDEEECNIENEGFASFLINFNSNPVLFDQKFVEVLIKLLETEKYSGRLLDVFQYTWQSFSEEGIFPIHNPKLVRGILEEFGPHENNTASKMGRSIRLISRDSILECLGHLVKDCRDECVSLLVGYVCSHSSLHDIFQHQFRFLYPDIKYKEKPCGMKLLHSCILNGFDTSVDMMLKVQDPVNSEQNWACAHFAAFGGHISLLERFGKNVEEEQKTKEGYSVLQAALLGIMHSDYNERRRWFFKKMIDTFEKTNLINVEVKSEPVGINFAEDEEYKKVLNFLYESKRYQFQTEIAEIVDEFGNNVFHYLIVHKKYKALDLMLKLGKENVHHRNNTELPTALHVAVYLGRGDCVKALWEAGVRVKPSDLSLAETLCLGKRENGRMITFYSCGIVNSEMNKQLEELCVPIFKYASRKDFKMKVITNTLEFGDMDDYSKTEEILKTLEMNN